ncbi:unnamed protein product [Gongylonema pulchrum]|uniref:Uncharacterized protein n=1 Tax=Gongylonema pulchrum TaxID=637853 RepID=A0A183EAL1_9BILA|nr:unnamed protein product [Gongylonema pulchrum]
MKENANGRSPPPHKTELVAQNMLKDLLGRRSFQKHLIESTAEQLMYGAAKSHSDSYGQQHFVVSNAGFESPTSYCCAVIDENIGMLVRLLDLIAESFIRSSNLAFCDIGVETNRDTAALFAVRVQVDRFLNSNSFQLLQFEQIVRRLCALLRCFAIRISTPFQIANCAFYAGSLCDLLYRFEEFCSIQNQQLSGNFEQLRKAIDSFHSIVVIHLNKMLAARFKETCAAKKAQEQSSPSKRTPQRPKSATTFREVEHVLRSPGYLLPHDLRVSEVSSTYIERRYSVIFTI